MTRLLFSQISPRLPFRDRTAEISARKIRPVSIPWYPRSCSRGGSITLSFAPRFHRYESWESLVCYLEVDDNTQWTTAEKLNAIWVPPLVITNHLVSHKLACWIPSSSPLYPASFPLFFFLLFFFLFLFLPLLFFSASSSSFWVGLLLLDRWKVLPHTRPETPGTAFASEIEYDEVDETFARSFSPKSSPRNRIAPRRVSLIRVSLLLLLVCLLLRLFIVLARHIEGCFDGVIIITMRGCDNGESSIDKYWIFCCRNYRQNLERDKLCEMQLTFTCFL